MLPMEKSDFEEKYKELLKKYNSLLSCAAEGIWCFEADEPVPIDLPEDEIIELMYERGYLAECNDVMARMYGFEKKEDILGARLSNLLIKDDPNNIEYLRSFIRNGFRLIDGMSIEKDKEGNAHVFVNNFIGEIEDGKLIRAWGTQRDITEIKKKEYELRESELKFRKSFENITEGQIIGKFVQIGKDSYDFLLIDINPAFERITGRKKKDYIGKMLKDFYTPPALPNLKAVLDLKDTHKSISFESYVKPLDKYFIIRMYHIFGDLYGFIFIDVTELRKITYRNELLNKLLKAIRNVNQHIAKEKNRDKLLSGICGHLVETDVFQRVWIVLFDEKKLPIKSYNIGWGKRANNILKENASAYLPECVNLAKVKEQVLEVRFPEEFCKNCKLYKSCERFSSLIYPIKYESNFYGVLFASSNKEILSGMEYKNLFVEVGMDISYALHALDEEEKRKEVEKKLRFETELLQTLMDNIPDSIYFKDVESRFIRINKAQAELLGIKNPLEAIGKTDFDFFDQDFAAEAFEDERRIIKTGLPLIDKIEKVIRDGKTRWLSATKVPIKSESGEVIGLVGITRDITERHLATLEIEESERKYRELTNLLPGVVFETDKGGNITFLNQQGMEIFNISSDQLEKGIVIYRLFKESEYEKAKKNFNKVRKTEIPISFESSIKTADGKQFPALVKISSIKIDNSFQGTRGIILDISEIKEAQEKLVRYAKEIEEFSLVSAEMLTVKDDNLLFELICKSIVEISDFSRLLFYVFTDEPPYRRILGAVGIDNHVLEKLKKAEASKEYYKSVFDRGIKLGRQSCYVPHTMKHILRLETVDFGKREYESGPDRWHREDNLFVALLNKEGELVGMLSLDDSKSGMKPTDETVKPIEVMANFISQILLMRQIEREAQRIQENLAHIEKIRALGEMAGGVAHDFNNVLSAILGRAQLLKRLNISPEVEHGLELIEKAALDGAETVQRIQDFTRLRSDKHFTTVNINDIVNDAIRYLRPKWKDEADSKGIFFNILKSFGDIDLVEGNESELREVFMNIISNSIDAMPEGGDILVRTSMEGKHVKVEITDTGVGMSEEVKKRVFDPFFTTKGVRGSGLGMSITYGIVTRHNGRILIDSKLGKGTTVKILLPSAKKTRKRRIIEKKEVELTDVYINKILVVDDDEGPKVLLEDILRLLGYDVVGARDGIEAFEIFKKDPEIDVVFTDLGMPQVSGFELATQVKKLRENTIVILVTGWGSQVNIKTAKEYGIDRVITKPFEFDEIQKVASECMVLKKQKILKSKKKP